MLKKTLAMTLAVIFVLFAFVSCGKTGIVGIWKISLSFGKLLENTISDELSGNLGMDLSLDLSSVAMDIELEIKKDGTYTISRDEETVSKALDDVFNAVVDSVTDILTEMSVSLDDIGMSKEEFRDFVSENISKDDLLKGFDPADKGTYVDNGTELVLSGEKESVMKYEISGKNITFELRFDDEVTLNGTGTKE